MTAAVTQEPQVYKVAEVARLLGVSWQHRAELIKKGDVPGGVKLRLRRR